MERLKNLLHIGLTQGDPNGIGPEMTAAALAHFANDPTLQLTRYNETHRAGADAVAQAVHDVMAHRIDGIVTAPINKQRWHAAGIPEPGHTEFLARCVSATSPPATRMLFAAPGLRVALATCHVPIHQVPQALTQENIATTIQLTDCFLRMYCGIDTPRLACLGLNPHAGEDGLLGHEEREVIVPTLRHLRTQAITVDGPYAADTFFARNMPYDAVIAMYHDQGLIPIKTLDSQRAVNITMGLPFVRVSVGHGTAEDIAGQGIADASNMIEAVRVAADLIRGRDPSVTLFPQDDTGGTRSVSF